MAYFDLGWDGDTECIPVKWQTPYTVYTKDDYKRCICDYFGDGEASCPQAVDDGTNDGDDGSNDGADDGTNDGGNDGNDDGTNDGGNDGTDDGTNDGGNDDGGSDLPVVSDPTAEF